MTDQEYHEWFSERAEKFAELGIMHPKSEWGRIVRIIIEVSMSEQELLKKKIDSLERKIKKIEKSVASAPAPTPNKEKRKWSVSSKRSS